MPAVIQAGHGIDRRQFFHLPGVVDEIRYIAVSQHPAAILLDRTMRPELTAIGGLQIPHRFASLPDGGNPAGVEGLQLVRRHAAIFPIGRVRDQRCIGGAAGGMFLGNRPMLPHLAVHKLRIEVAVEQDNAFRNVVEGAAKNFQFVHVTNDVGHVGVADHPAAIRQVGALHPDRVATGASQIERRGVAFPDQANTVGDISIDLGGCDLIRHGIAAVIHQGHERRIAVGDRVRQRPHAAEGAVDELGFQVGIQQQHTDIHDVERGTERQHLAAHDLIGALRLGGLGGFRIGGFRGLEHEADLLVGLPRPLARLRFALAWDQQMKVLGNAEHALHLDDGTGLGNPTDDAVDGGLTVIRYNLAGQERPAARHQFLFGHDDGFQFAWPIKRGAWSKRA